MTGKRFDKVLVANRGEIAVRVIRGIQEAGLKAVAVYSDADRNALHVRCADEAYYIGGSVPSESYLRTDKILEVCRKSGAQALHPGYGFLSENADFARELAAAGIVFIGPPAEAIESMGLKTRARDLMMAAGVPVVPGTPGLVDDPEEALAFAKEITFPVLVKATAGGGGKGMRRVDSADTFIADFAACKREATNAFGDGRVYVEKYITEPRHVEFQILADEHGNVRHLFERDCSIQRRHQKVIEETPCPYLLPETRKAMGEIAIKAAQAANYVGAGTIEFLLDKDQSFYFLEMNTRLQVEHAITEMVTGVDLVRAQIDIAQGLPITWSQEELTLRGSSIECRVYAEDPAAGFMPSPGVIKALRAPEGPFVRNDSGYLTGGCVPVHYDPLVSKLVVWGENRDAAIARMKHALRNYLIEGILTNIDFHLLVLDDPAFISGHYNTAYIPDLLASGSTMARECPEDLQDLAAIAAAISATLSLTESTSQGSSGTTAGDGDASPWRMLSRMRRLQRS